MEEARAGKRAGMQGLTMEEEEDWGERSAIEETEKLEGEELGGIASRDRKRETGFWWLLEEI